MSQNDEVLFEERGCLGLITLNRPKALNSLTLDMVRAMRAKLLEWEQNDAVVLAVIQGAGEKGFCAGGDIRALHDSGKEGTPYALQFFADEYRNNALIARYTKPYVAIMDGITMGGGVGVSAHGSHRIVTDKTVFAMPETGIGLIPDVGGSYVLGHCPGHIGAYLGLTGARLGTADTLYTGVGTHYVAGSDFEPLIADLAAIGRTGDPHGAVDACLASHQSDPGEAPLASQRGDIDRLFAGGTVEAIIEALKADGGTWANQQLEILSGKSPTSMKLTLRAVQEGRSLPVEACLKMEYRLVSRIMEAHDFYEGVRSVIIDRERDRSPKWNPDTLDGVSDADVERYFADLGSAELDLE